VGEVVASERLRALIAELKQSADYVFIDAPPLLLTSDAVTLGSIVDAIVLVAEVDRLRLEMLDDVTRALSMCAAPTVGWVASGDDVSPEYGNYGSYGSANGRV
jgi:Mrp family chromosome partitioning ATPase